MRQDNTISHTGQVLEAAGADTVTLDQNQVDPQRMTEIITFECPRNFDSVTYEAPTDPVRFQPRTHEEAEGPGGSYELDTNVQPVAGEQELEDQPYPSVIATDENGEEIHIEEVDTSTEVVHFTEDQDGTVNLFPIISDGTIQMRVLNTLDQDEGPLYPWEFPVYRWHDMKQEKRGTEVNLQGAARIYTHEKLQIMMDSPDQLVWEHDAYPGSYVSLLELDVTIDY